MPLLPILWAARGIFRVATNLEYPGISLNMENSRQLIQLCC